MTILTNRIQDNKPPMPPQPRPPTTPAPPTPSDSAAYARIWLAAGALFGLLAVVAGAAGTHALRDALDADALRVFETAARFQMYHALALLAVGLLAMRRRSLALNVAGALFALGTLLFSGSLYALALSGVGVLGAVAPVGGVCLMAGWAALAVTALRRQ